MKAEFHCCFLALNINRLSLLCKNKYIRIHFNAVKCVLNKYNNFIIIFELAYFYLECET